MKKIFVSLFLAALLAAGSAFAAEAEEVSGENYLTMEQQLEIVSVIKFAGVNLMSEGVPAYDPTKLEVSCPLPVYAYKDDSFEEVGRYLPLFYEGEALFFILDHENGYGLNYSLGRWWRQYDVRADKPLALVLDYDSCYVFDGADWLLLHKAFDVHMKNQDYDVLDTQSVDTVSLPLTQLRPVLSLKNAYLGHFPADEDVTIYFNGEKLAATGWLTKGRTLLPLRDICDMLGVQVEYSDVTQKITLHNRQDVYTLRLNECGIQYNGQELPALDVPARERDGCTYLPLRYLANILQVEVSWDEAKRRVDLQTDSQALYGVVHHVLATMENWDMRLDSPVQAKQLYSLIWEYCLLDEVTAPQHIGRWPNLDIPDFYYLLTGYDFLLADGSSAASWEIYVHVPNQPLADGYCEYLLCADGKWYNLTDDIEELLAEYHNLPNWQRLD